jgi:hypothetical protein
VDLRVLLLVSSAVVAGCGGDDGPGDAAVSSDASEPDAAPPPFVPDLECPGAPGCPDVGDGVLFAGAAAVAITPPFDESTEILTLDADGDHHYDARDDEFRDTNGNGRFDGLWIAGFSAGRPASGVADDQWARAVALRQNETTIVLVSLDVIGWFHDQTQRIREMAADADADYILVSSTHTHEARDTIGIWGRSSFEYGVEDAYNERVRRGAVSAVRRAVAGLVPARVTYATISLRDQPGGMLRYVSDRRDPKIIDDEVRVLRFSAASDERTVATVINFGSHPEYAGSDNTLLSSDYPHWLRRGVEEGAAGPDGTTLAGLGGVAVFLQGALGGQIGPQELEPARWDGTPVPEDQLLTAETVGDQLAWMVLDALGDGGGAITDETADLAVRTRSMFLDVENRVYQFAALGGLFVRETYNWDMDRPLVEDSNEPDILSEIAVIDIGRAQLLSVPGEIDPALFVGGWDGSWSPAGVDFISPDAVPPPDLSRAPPPPYLRDLMRSDAQMRGILGNANDFIGYLVPAFDYALASPGAYFDEAPGQHYEETNSLGPAAWPTIESELHRLLAWPDRR